MFAYLYFAVAVIIAMTSVGFALGSGLVVAIGIDWNWVAVLVGVLVGAALAIASVLTNMPMIVLTVLSSIGARSLWWAGSCWSRARWTRPTSTWRSIADRVSDDWWWYALFLVLALAGLLIQTRDMALMRAACAPAGRPRPRPRSLGSSPSR